MTKAGYAVLFSVLLTAMSFPSGDQLPEELREIARQLHCGPVPGFYDRPGIVDPPYLYGGSSS